MEIVFLIYLSAATLQLLFYGLAFVRFSIYKPYENPLAISDAPVSVIICARNELENLKNLLPKLKKQAYSRFEIILVDDRSDDGTYEFLQEEKKNNPLLKVVRVDFVPDHVQPKKFALTLGIKAAENDRILLTDADCEPATIHWIRAVASQFNDPVNFVIGYSYFHRERGLLNLFARFETIHTAILYLSAALGGNPYMAVGRNLGYRKSFFLSVKGFQHDLRIVGGDDDLLVNRYASGKNSRAVISSDSVVMSWTKNKWKDYFVQKKRHLSVGKRYKWKDKFVLSVFYLSKIVFWLLAASLLIVGFQWPFVAGAVLLILLLIIGTFYQLCHRTGTKYEFQWLLFMEILYVLYLIVFGIVANLSKKIRWR